VAYSILDRLTIAFCWLNVQRNCCSLVALIAPDLVACLMPCNGDLDDLELHINLIRCDKMTSVTHLRIFASISFKSELIVEL
jgi:hypothetical protein